MPKGKQSHRVVVVGAGFAGLSAVQALANAPVEVILIDRHNYHLFQPLLYQVATAALTPAEIAAPIRKILRNQKNVTIFMDEVCGVSPTDKSVTTSSGREFSYDTLVLATGARHGYFGNSAWEQHAPGLKTIDDAFELRMRILSAFEKAEAAETTEMRQALLTFIVVGGGPTGVEMAGAIAELSHSMARDFRRIDSTSARIILIEGGDRVLPTFRRKLSESARKALVSLGVDVRTDARVTDIGDCRVTIADKDVRAGTVIWAAGVQASPAATWLGVDTGRSGHVQVGKDLRVEGFDDVYAIGDTAAHIPDGADQPLPGVAPVAKQMGAYVGTRISKYVQGKSTVSNFEYKNFGSMATIGRNRAIAELGALSFRGLVGWLLWGIVHIYFLVGFRNRLILMLNWLWAYVTWQRGVRLITGESAYQPKKHVTKID